MDNLIEINKDIDKDIIKDIDQDNYYQMYDDKLENEYNSNLYTIGSLFYLISLDDESSK